MYVVNLWAGLLWAGVANGRSAESLLLQLKYLGAIWRSYNPTLKKCYYPFKAELCRIWAVIIVAQSHCDGRVTCYEVNGV